MACLVSRNLLAGGKFLNPYRVYSRTLVTIQTRTPKCNFNRNFVTDSISISKWPSKPSFGIQGCYIHCSAVLQRREEVTEEQLELVNIYSPNETLIMNETPVIYLERFCNSFPSYTYTEITVRSKDNKFRSLKFEKKPVDDEIALEKKTEKKNVDRKDAKKVTVSLTQLLKSIKKLQAVVVQEGEAFLVIKTKPKKTKEDDQRKRFSLEQFVKEEMQNICTFQFVSTEPLQTTYNLKRVKENDDFYKRIFEVVYSREKEEISMIMDYFSTVKSYSGTESK